MKSLLTYTLLSLKCILKLYFYKLFVVGQSKFQIVWMRTKRERKMGERTEMKSGGKNASMQKSEYDFKHFGCEI